MTTLEEGLFTRLSTYAGLVALCSTRIYPLRLPYQPVLPAVTYQRISTRTLQMFPSTAKSIARFQVTAWAVSYDDMVKVAAQIILALDAYVGTMGVACTWTLVGATDLIDPETQWYYRPIDFEVWYG